MVGYLSSFSAFIYAPTQSSQSITAVLEAVAYKVYISLGKDLDKVLQF